ncbi:MAG: hypothetical protein A2Z25_08190 [Planctomycetes bacterium RBG_16_55_9]|nr:MAG: hypothetical protein A2Z25_08190 [Planctomycetes bacterium RBG_16_55_9]
MSVRVKCWKVAAVIAVVIGAGALATTVGLKVRKLYFTGREPDGTYIFQTKPETVETEKGRTMTSMRMVGVAVAPNETIDVDQKIKDLEEVELLRQQDAGRELMSVVETEVNGQPQPRSFGFKYVLSDGREIKIQEDDPNTQGLKRHLTEAQRDEIFSLMRSEEYKELDGKEEQVRGRTFVFTRQRYVLSDGTEVIKSVGRPKTD